MSIGGTGGTSSAAALLAGVLRFIGTPPTGTPSVATPSPGPTVVALLIAAGASAGAAGIVCLGAPAPARAQEASAVRPQQRGTAGGDRGVRGRVPDPAAVELEALELAPGEEPAVTGQELDDLTARVAARLRCPVCRNQSVLESSASLAQEMQQVIRARLRAGESPAEVEAYFIDRYGEWILLKPKAEGVNLLVYLLPALLLLGGLVGVALLLRRWAAAPEESGAGDAGRRGGADPGRAEADGGLDPEEERRLAEVLGERG